MKNKETKLMKKHPNLFRTVFLVGFCNLLIAAFTALDSPRASLSFARITSIEIVHQPQFWFFFSFLAGILCLAGIFTRKYQFARIGLVISAAIGGFLAFGFWISYFSSNIVGISAPVIWSFYMFICIINSSEPTVNPLSAVLQQDIHKTLSGNKHTEGLNHDNN